MQNLMLPPCVHVRHCRRHHICFSGHICLSSRGQASILICRLQQLAHRGLNFQWLVCRDFSLLSNSPLLWLTLYYTKQVLGLFVQ